MPPSAAEKEGQGAKGKSGKTQPFFKQAARRAAEGKNKTRMPGRAGGRRPITGTKSRKKRECKGGWGKIHVGKGNEKKNRSEGES